LYLEEHEPSLESAVLTAVEKADEPDDPLVLRLVTDALDRTRNVEYGQRVDRTLLYRYSGILAGVGVLGVFLFLLGPSTLRTGATALLFPNRQAEDLTPFSIQVAPGDVTIAQGSDQLVSARLLGFESGEVELVTLDGDGNVVDAAPMFSDAGLDGSPVEGAEEPGGFQRMMLNVEEPIRYFVRSSGVRSPTFTIDVAEIPYVDRLEMVYHFPSYTGLEPRTVESGGHIAVLPGTRVELRATSSVATDRGRLVLDDSSEVALTPDEEGFLAGEMTVDREGGYVVELERPDGRMGAASPHYSIDLLSDQPPLVEFEKPGRDSRASAIEEVFLQVRGEDDYGIRSLDLVYSVNGESEDTVRLVGDAGPPTTDVSAGHTLFLEEWDLVPGDVISYYAVARDNNGVTGSQEVVSDIYFLSVRRFSQEFTAAEQSGGGGGGGGGGGQPPDQGAFVEIQKQILAATFNLVRDREGYVPSEWRSDLSNVSLSQERLRGDVSTLLDRIRTRMRGSREEAFQIIVRELPQALEAMDVAVDSLEASEARGAISPEQRALLHLQRADAAYQEVQVQLQQGGGGGGGGGSPQAQDLADLFELELDKLENQYETVDRGQREQANQELDEVTERLRELARRQQQEAERQRRQLQSSGGAPGSQSSQQALADETEEAARQLERLARERRSPELEQTARELREAAESMRRSAAGDRGDGLSDAESATDRLQDARRLLDENRTERFQEDVDRALERARSLRAQQQDVQQDLSRLDSEDREAQQEAMRRLMERKVDMGAAVGELARRVDQAAARARREDREAANPLQDAADRIRESQLEDKIRYSRSLVGGDRDRSREFEEEIAGDLDSVVEQLERAGEAADQSSQGSSLEEALGDARSLTRGMETLGRRLREGGQGEQQQGEQGDQGRQGQEGQGGQQGDEGQEGQQSQEGRQGQQGDQGQQGQEGQQGAQGQQGQSGQQGGQPGGARAGGAQDGFGPDGGDRFGGAWGGPRSFDPDERRQLGREFGERAGDAADLRDRLRDAGRDTQDLERVIDALRSLEEAGIYDDPEEVLRLQEQALEHLQTLEFELRRELGAEDGPPVGLPGSDDVPAEFRELVEEYYRNLSREQSSGG
ncbi:MAG: DUF4175 family protein, partial [Gemmatimonadota bacterium]